MSKERAAVDAFKKSYGNSVGTVEEKRKLRKKAWETFKDEIQKEEARPNKKKRKSSRKRVKMPNELREAVQNGDIAATERLLNDNSQWTNSTTDEGYTGTGFLIQISVAYRSSSLALGCFVWTI